jgi:hypothetical protein
MSYFQALAASKVCFINEKRTLNIKEENNSDKQVSDDHNDGLAERVLELKAIILHEEGYI